MGKIIKSLLAALIILLASWMIYLYLYGGDMLLRYLGRQMGVQFIYKGRCSGVEAFIFRKTHLKGLKVKIPEAGITIGADKAELEFDFSDVAKSRAIGISSVFYSPFFEQADPAAGKKNISLFSFLPGVFSSITGEKEAGKIDRLYCDIVLCGDSAKVRNIMIFAGEIIFNVRGELKKSGDITGRLSAYFSPDIVAKLPQEAMGLFIESNNPWKAFKVSFTLKPKQKFFKVEGDRFRLTIGE